MTTKAGLSGDLETSAYRRHRRRERFAAFAGMIAGPLFLFAVIALTWLEYDFLRSLGWTVLDEHDVPWPSGLALGPYGWAQMLNFAVAGVLLLIFIHTLRTQLPDRRSARVAAYIMMLVALALFAAAAPTDRNFTAAPSTWHGWTHLISFLLISLGSTVGPLVTAWALRGDPRWRPMAPVSLAVGLICPASFLISSQVGFYLFLVAIFGWFTALAIRLARLAAATTASG